MSDFTRELEDLINRHCKENDSNTPDFLLAKYMDGCLKVYSETIMERDKWFGFSPFSSNRHIDDPLELTSNKPIEPDSN